MVRPLAYIILAASILFAGCSTTKPTLTITPPPLIPIQAATDTLVWVENLCEDPEEDARTFTTIEAVSDMFLMPVVAVVYVARVAAIVLVALPLAYMGHEVDVTVERIKLALPYPTAGPNPDTTDYKNIEVVDSCLLPQEEDEGSGQGDLGTRQRMHTAR